LLGQVRDLAVGCQAGYRGDVRGVREQQHELVGADIRRHDALWTRLRSACRHSEKCCGDKGDDRFDDGAR
jgi:hypothetical protein